MSAKLKRCIDQGNDPGAKIPILYVCDRGMTNQNQLWSFTNTKDPPPQKDRNFHDDKTYVGKIALQGFDREPDMPGSLCLGYSPKDVSPGLDHDILVGMHPCSNKAEDQKLDFDLIW